MKSFKVITVCGAGVGTSTLLRMNIDKTFKQIIDKYTLYT